MKIVSYNINGIRSSFRKGLGEWIKNFDGDVYCFQEVRADENIVKSLISGQAQIDMFTSPEKFCELNMILNCGSKPGYAGTMILCKNKPDIVFYDMGEIWHDDEGRTTTAVFGNLAIVNSYIPNGNSRLEFKMSYLAALTKYISGLREKYNVICLGDFNIAHNEIDLTNPKECKNKSVFLPIEREAFGEILNVGLIDSFRFCNPQKREYSWRSYRSLQDNYYNGWKYRIDYVLSDEKLKEKIVSSSIIDVAYSDHLPVVLEINL